MSPPRLPQVRLDQEVINLDGGLDLVSTSLRQAPGSLIDGANFVPDIGGGYRRVGGYERFDGRPAPSAATYYLLELSGMGSISVGSIIAGATSLATAAVSTVGVGAVGVTKLSGTFSVGETVSVSGIPVGTVSSFEQRGAQSLREDVTMRADAADIYRADIGAVPGSGPVRGVHAFDGKVYAWRDNAGGTALVMHVSSPSGWQAVAGVPALAPGGRVRCINFNFSGGATGMRMFGVDGKNKAFQYDGTTYVQITTGAATDTPSCVIAHRNRLVVSIFGSLFISGAGAPTTGWSGITSTPAEIGVSDLITDLMVLSGSDGTAALAVFCRNRVSVLYGSSPTDFRLDPAVPDCGAVSWTAQNIGTGLYLDTDELRDLAASDTFGNFASSGVSERVKPLLKRQSQLVTCSSLLRSENQYRLWFSDGTGIAFRVDGRKVGSICQIRYTHPVSCIFSGDDSQGREVIYFGSDNGFVYQAEVGTSFDGAAIDAWLRTSFTHARSPSVKKSWKRARLDVDVAEFAEIEFGYDHDFASTEQWVGDQKSQDLSGAGAIWDSTLVWDSFVWDSPYLSPPLFKLDGTSINISFSIRSSSRLSLPFAVESLLIHFINRRLEKGGA